MLSSRSEKVLVWLIGTVLFTYVLLRAIFVPIAHDESVTFFIYANTGDLFPFYAKYDANNHFINSFLTRGSFLLFGAHIWALRLPNVLAFILYVFFARKITLQLHQPAIRWISFTAFITAQFVFEFFALSRGYGLSMAFLLGVVWYLWRYFSTGSNLYLLLTMLFTSLCVWSNLSLMCVMLLVFFLWLGNVTFQFFSKRTWPGWRQWMIVFLAGILPCFIAIAYTFTLKEAGALYHGKLEGFVAVTFDSLLVYQLGAAYPWVRVVVEIIFFGTLAGALLAWYKSRFSVFTLREISVFLLAGCLAGTFLLAYIMQVNYPSDRAALYFIPLFLLAFAFTVQWLYEQHRVFIIFILVLLYFPVQLVLHANLNVTVMWPDQAFPYRFYTYMREQQEKSKEKLTFSCYGLHEVNWGMYNINSKKPLNAPQLGNETSDLSDWQILLDERYEQVKNKYEVVLDDRAYKQVLAKRKKPMKKTLVKIIDGPVTDKNYCEEFYNIYAAWDDSIPAGNFLIDIDFTINTQQQPLQAQFVFDSKSKNRDVLWYDYTRLDLVKPIWKNASYEFSKCCVTLPRETHEFTVYLWNIKKAPIEIKKMRMKLYSLTEP